VYLQNFFSCAKGELPVRKRQIIRLGRQEPLADIKQAVFIRKDARRGRTDNFIQPKYPWNKKTRANG